MHTFSPGRMATLKKLLCAMLYQKALLWNKHLTNKLQQWRTRIHHAVSWIFGLMTQITSSNMTWAPALHASSKLVFFCYIFRRKHMFYQLIESRVFRILIIVFLVWEERGTGHTFGNIKSSSSNNIKWKMEILNNEWSYLRYIEKQHNETVAQFLEHTVNCFEKQEIFINIFCNVWSSSIQ